MRLQDNDGNDYDVSLLRGGPDGTLDAADLERAIDEELVGREGCEVGVALMDDGLTLASLWFEKAGFAVVEALLSRGLLAGCHRFGEEAVALMRRHPRRASTPRSSARTAREGGSAS